MNIYLAGGLNGNCKPEWVNLLSALYRGGEDLKLYLAGTQGRRWCVDDYIFSGGGCKQKYDSTMNLYLAGVAPWRDTGIYDYSCGVNILESFYYSDEWTEKIIPICKNFLLDSGAFTFFTAAKGVNWDDYIEKYIDFINRNKVSRFFELDIDSLVGYEKVKEYRRRIEKGTGRQCIPVWHKSRGEAEFKRMCEEYSYVAIGGIVSGEIRPPEYKYFPHFINIAHKNNALIHGLGFTNLNGLKLYHFDSVDSTAWTTGNRFGKVFKFDGKTIVSYTGNGRLKAKEAATNNFNEWVKFQKYAETHL